MSSGKVKCTCGWSWNKSDSSKKDMYICHECGRDNSNNMKNGGWLNDIEKSQNGKKVLPETEADRAKKVARQVAGATGIGMVLDQFPGVETTYDVYNVIDAYRQGDPMKILPNMLGALIPGTAGKAFEAITDEYLPNTPEKEKQKMKAVLKGKRATPKQMKKAQESVDWSGGFKKLYDDVSSLFEEPSLIDKEKVIKYFNNNRKVQLENGGWLDSYANGGTMQEHQENYNDPQVSLPEGFVGMGNNTKGRDYSPAWGGQFKDGGEIPNAQKGKKVKPIYVESKNDPRYKAYQDSLFLHNFYKDPSNENDGYQKASDAAIRLTKLNKKEPQEIKTNIYKGLNQNKKYIRQAVGYEFKKPQQEVKVKPTTTKQTTKPTSGYILQADGSKLYDKSIPAGKFFDPDKHLGDGPIKFQDIPQDRKPVTSVVNNLTLAGLGNNPLEINTNFPELRPQVRPVKDWKYIWKHAGTTQFGYVNSPEDMDHWVDWRDWYSTGGGKDKGDSVTITPEYQMGGNIYPVNYVPQAAMGGSLPGAGGHFYARYEEGGKVPGDVGFDYPRTINPAPDNGPGAKKTMASAQNGQEMKYYQEGLDFKPKSISKNGGWLSKYDVAQAGAQVEYGTPEYEEAYNKGEVITDEGVRSPILLDEVVVEGKPLTEFGKTRKEIAAKNKWEDYAQKYLGNFEKNMGQTLENLPESRKQEYEDYVNKLAFDEYIKTHPQVKGEERGAYIDRMQAENANSSNFERAYEANADYNDATDVNKWRRGLIGLGSLVLPKPAMDYMKQESDYFSKKEKQAMIDNPISTQVGDVLGTLEPLTVPVESLYGDKSFGDIASGQSANIPMTARILGDPLMLGFEAAPLIGSGFRTAGRLLGTEEGLLSNAWKLNPRAYQYNLPENTMWRGLGKTGLDDALENKVLRTANKTGNYGEDLYITTDFNTAKGNYSIDQPTYKGDPFSEIDDWEQILPKDTKSYIAEIPESALTNKNIVNNSSIVINKGSIPTNDVRLLKQDWWQGYKPIEVPTSSLENSYPSFKQITNAPENINAEHLAGLIKREADWLRSPEYLKRKMNATGRSEASIKKESEEIINHINNTSIDYTGTNESNVVGLYSSGKNPKIRVFDGIPEYPYSDHPFYTGTLDHEVKHAFSESAYTSDKALDFIQNTGYKNYPKANLNKTFGDRVKSAFDKNWANLSAEQQVTGRRMMDVIEKDQGIKRGTELTDANIDQLVESLKLNRYVDDDIYHVATQFKRKFGDDYKKHLKDFLNKAWMSVPAVIGLDAASETDKKKDGGIIDSDRGQWDHPGKVTRIKGGNITMKRDPKTGKALTQPILGIANTGERQWMYPGQDYQFQNAEYVTEYPKGKLAKNGNELVKLDQLTNFTNYNKPQPGGWLNKYN